MARVSRVAQHPLSCDYTLRVVAPPPARVSRVAQHPLSCDAM